ncbi:MULTISPECIES: hypothetical protein [Burkholderiaceae]|uniref:AbrB/MazE/SpoVT family DNA-binding domain-containing protein n=1 Tax=Burkholderiaceae TaxID=119060 RepID=UPI000ACB8342|nr:MULTISPECIES: hypothetical protein [Burkholderiaceae]MCW3657673.1 hypothetical protein [Burkholderia cenocepacia]MDN7927480.1 hypothetical protein [Burkholderia vietnamiensis]MDS0808989.1 hypothetical protein [Burkholderia cenocepacia]HDR8996002.1 hypothetical protein [Burkholderia vietnamiensis]HDR9248631.1 hypothetical protein [Burkholderia vietnamiensis]
MNAKKSVTIEEMNEVIAESRTAAGLAGLVPAAEIDAWVASCRTENVSPVPLLADLLVSITPDNRHGEIDFGPPVGREIPDQDN